MNKRAYFLIFLFFGLNFILILFYSSFLFLKKNNEHLSIDNIILKQKNYDVIYSSSINLDYQKYITKKYKIIKPDLLLLGTSRIQYHPNFLFKKKFLIAQQPFYSFDMFQNTINNLINIHKPKVIVVGIDWWLFNRNFNQGFSKIYFNNLFEKNIVDREDSNKNFLSFSFNELIKPYKWLFQKKITVNYFLDTITKKNFNNNIGVTANVNNSGYDFSGYYVDNFRVSGKKGYDVKFQNTIYEIKHKKKSFIDFEFDEESISIFKNINKISKKNNIKILFFMPPVAPTIYKMLNETNYIANLSMIKKKLNYNPNFYDFTFKDYYNDCQFIDGYHSGEVLNFINLKEILSKNNLHKIYLNPKITTEVQKKNIFRTTFKNINNKIISENDFLNIGCKK